MTAQDVIYMALRRVGHLRPGYTPSPELFIDALNEWAAFFDELGAERHTQYSNPVFQHNVTGPGSQTNGNGYQIGPTAADWVQPRPTSIIRANLVLLNTGPQLVYLPLQPITQEEWANLAIQQIPPISVTSLFWYDPQFPNGVFNVFPPLSGNAIQIYQWGVLQPPVAFANAGNVAAALATSYAMPPGYEEMTISGIAERMYNLVSHDLMIHKVPYVVVAAKAARSLAKIKNLNRALPRLISDAPHRQGGDAPFYDQNVTWTGEPY